MVLKTIFTILDRYIACIFLKFLILAVLSLSFLFLFQSVLPEFYEHRYEFKQILIYYALSLPQILIQIAPPAVLLATVFTLSGLARTHELIALYSIGWGIRRVVSLLFGIVFLISLFLLFMQDRVLPPVFQFRTRYHLLEMQKKMDFFLDFKKNKIWYRSENKIYNLQQFDSKNNTIYGIFLYVFDDAFELVEVLGAKQARYSLGGWILSEGVVTHFPKGHFFPVSENFKEKKIQIAETPQEFQEIEKEVDGLNMKKLHEYIHRMKKAGTNTKMYEVKFQSRLSLSFIPMVMFFLALPFSIRTEREGGMVKNFGICLGLIFFYWLFYSIGLSLGISGSFHPILAAWLPSFVFTVLAGILIFYKK